MAARSFSKDFSVAATAAIGLWYELYRLCLLQGGTSIKDSDGTTYSSSGAQVTSGSSGAHGLDNASAWKVWQLANGVQICIQRGSASSFTCRLKVSRSAGFVGGSPSATQVPSATDEVVLYGGGTDAAPTFANYGHSTLTEKAQIMAGSDGSCYLISYRTTERPDTFFAVDVMASGSYDTGDAAPFVIVSSLANSIVTVGDRATLMEGLTACHAWLNLAGTYTHVSCSMEEVYSGGSRLYPDADVASHITGKDPTRPVNYSRPSAQTAPQGDKGTSTIFRLPGISRSHCDTYNIASANDYVRLGDVLCVWDGGTGPTT